MKVSKIIREYVTETVEKIYGEKIKEVREGSENIKTAIEAELATILQDAETKAAAVLVKYPDFTMATHWNKATLFNRNSSIINNQTEEKINALYAEQSVKIQTILVSLELGGTKADLDEMLKNL